jgi:YD repeat-containing protein
MEPIDVISSTRQMPFLGLVPALKPICSLARFSAAALLAMACLWLALSAEAQAAGLGTRQLHGSVLLEDAQEHGGTSVRLSPEQRLVPAPSLWLLSLPLAALALWMLRSRRSRRLAALPLLLSAAAALAAWPLSTLSSSSGGYTLAMPDGVAFPAGVYRLELTHAGYGPRMLEVAIEPGGPERLELPSVLLLAEAPAATPTPSQPVPTSTPSATQTPPSPSSTPTPPPPSTPEAPASTPTAPPSSTPTAPPSDTATPSATATASSTPSETATVSQTPAPTPTPTPDPSEIVISAPPGAPELDQTVAADFGAATEFLYSGPQPVQIGVAAGAIERRRVAVLRGRVLDSEGSGLWGVEITVLGHAELGRTYSREDGAFDIAVNGGGLTTVQYRKAGYLPAQRQTQVPWRRFAHLPDVRLVPLDPEVTEIEAGSGQMQSARASVVSDADGQRQATLLFQGGTDAAMTLADGTQVPLSSLGVRATEYTVGPGGPQAMPAALPATSAYTYAVELSVDEALAAGASRVSFSKPVVFYVENFLGFPTGTQVPVGWYDAGRGVWEPSDDGRVIEILGVEGGLAELDVTGSGEPAGAAALASLGITDEERQNLAGLYTPGQGLWRAWVLHFSPYDLNWGVSPEAGAEEPACGPLDDWDPFDDCYEWLASLFGIDCMNQTAKSAVQALGAALNLAFSGERVPGRKDTRELEMPLDCASGAPGDLSAGVRQSSGSLPAVVKGIEVEAYIAGRHFARSYPPVEGQRFVLSWDGRDAYGRPVQGAQRVFVRIGYVYDTYYNLPPSLDRSFGEASGTPYVPLIRSRASSVLWQELDGILGTWDASVDGLGGLTIDVQHRYAPDTQTFYSGAGGELRPSRRSTSNPLSPSITTAAGAEPPPFDGDGGPATQASLHGGSAVVVAPDGTMYIADTYHNRIRRVDPDGTIEAFAGMGGYTNPAEDPTGGDGGPAIAATFDSVWGLALGPDGSLYVADSDGDRIRRIGPDGIISAVAGNGAVRYSGDGAPALNAAFNEPASTAIGPDGTLYIADSDNHRIRRVGLDGRVSTVAGTGTAGAAGDGGPASLAELNRPRSLSFAPDGSLYIADTANHRIRKIDPSGIIGTVAGTGTSGQSGDGGPAAEAQLNSPEVVRVDSSGGLYIADTGSSRVRRIDPAGVISTVAGTGTAGFGGDGAPAIAAQLSRPKGLALGADGTLYISDTENHRIRAVNGQGTISTVAGTGVWGYGGDGGAATAAWLGLPRGIDLGADGSLYIADSSNVRVRKVSGEGTISTVAGTGLKAYYGYGDGGAATAARMRIPASVTVLADGTFYISDPEDGRIRQVSPAGIITTAAGNSEYRFGGDDGPALSASFNFPQGMAVGPDGSVYIADTWNNCVRRVSPDGVVTRFAGSLFPEGMGGDGGPATESPLYLPHGLALAGDGSLYITESGGDRVRRVDPNGVITTVAGTGVRGYSGDGGPATEARLNRPNGIVLGPDGSIYFIDESNVRVRKVDPEGIITTVAGTGVEGFHGDGGEATEAQMRWPYGLAMGPDGSLFVAELWNSCVRRISPEGIITTVAGNFNGDGWPASEAPIGSGGALAVGPDGSIYLPTQGRVRRIGPDGIIRTVAGNGNTQPLGSGGPATAAGLFSPAAVTVGADGAFYVAASSSSRVYRIDAQGIITSIAGTGSFGFSGDGGPASSAQLSFPKGLALGADGSLFIADQSNNRVRKIAPDGIITTVAGTGTHSFGGDGGPATAARLRSPSDVAVGPDGSLFIADRGNRCIRRVTPDGTIRTVAGTPELSGDQGDGAAATLARIGSVSSIAVTPDGTLYLADETNHRIRRVSTNGIITTVAGGASQYVEGSPATAGRLQFPGGIAAGPDGALYVSDSGAARIRRISPPLPGYTGSETAIASPGGAELYVFDEQGRHLRTVEALMGVNTMEFGYDASGLLSTLSDRHGNVTSIVRGENGQASAIVGPYGHATLLEYDDNGYLARAVDPALQSEELQFSAEGLLLSRVDRRGSSYGFHYDERGRVTRATDPEGGSADVLRTESPGGFIVESLSALGRRSTVEVERLPQGAERHIIRPPDGLAREKLKRLDASVRFSSPDGMTSEYKPSPDPRFGMQAPLAGSLSITSPGGLSLSASHSRTAVQLDASDPLGGASVTDTWTVNGRSFVTSYSALDRKMSSVSAEGRRSEAVLDELGRVAGLSIPGLAALGLAYDERGRLQSAAQGSRGSFYAYDERGRLERITDPAGREVSFEYDLADRPVLERLPDGREIRFSYDENGNLTSVTPPGRPAHAHSYTAVDQQKDYTPPAAPGPDITSYTYNEDRQLTRALRPDGQSIELEYDSAGRLSRIDAAGRDYLYSFDEQTGLLSSVAGPGGSSLGFAYDGSLPLGTTWSGMVSGSVTHSLDNNLRVTSQTVSGAHEIAFAYDNDGLTTQAGALSLEWDPDNGLLVGTALASIAVAYGYNDFGEVTSYSASMGESSLLSFDYTRDELGRIIERIETVEGVSTSYGYTYDTAGRLTEVRQSGALVVGYGYDSNSNRVNRTVGQSIELGSYDAQDRLLEYGSASFTYSQSGELASKTQGGATSVYTYDVLGNLEAVDLPNGSRIEGLVRPFGQKGVFAGRSVA